MLLLLTRPRGAICWLGEARRPVLRGLRLGFHVLQGAPHEGGRLAVILSPANLS